MTDTKTQATVTVIKSGKIVSKPPAEPVEPDHAEPTNADIEAAKNRAQDINQRLGRMSDDAAMLPVLVVEAWNDNDWQTLGYDTWEGYVAEEFQNLPRLTDVMRKSWTRQIRDETEPSMPLRAISAVTGAHYATASRDLAEDDSEPVAPATPRPAAEAEANPWDYWTDLSTAALRYSKHHQEIMGQTPDPKLIRTMRSRIAKALKTLDAYDSVESE